MVYFAKEEEQIVPATSPSVTDISTRGAKECRTLVGFAGAGGRLFLNRAFNGLCLAFSQ